MKKKLFIALLLCLVLCMSFSLTAFASGIGYVTDTYGLLSQDELAALNEQAKTVSEFYNCGVYVVVVEDYTDYVNGSIADFSEAIYKSYALGLGEGKDGIVLSLSMAERDYDLCAYGDFANYAFTDYGKGKLAETFLDNFRNNDWFGGFGDYIGNTTTLMEKAKQGEPLDIIVYEEIPEEPGLDAMEIALIVGVSCAVAFAVCSVFKAQMKNTGKRRYANEYMNFTRSDLRVKRDQFLRRDVVRTYIPKDDDVDRPSGGRPGGTTINSGGFSHSSGKF